MRVAVFSAGSWGAATLAEAANMLMARSPKRERYGT